ncbi:unnamed protein product, partial [Amoebophrya sp. A25]|eukprot:GSA25T00020291001.1
MQHLHLSSRPLTRQSGCFRNRGIPYYSHSVVVPQHAAELAPGGTSKVPCVVERNVVERHYSSGRLEHVLQLPLPVLRKSTSCTGACGAPGFRRWFS